MNSEKGLTGFAGRRRESGLVQWVGLLGVLLALAVGAPARAQIKIPKARDLARYTDSIANLTQIDRMKVLFYEGFDATNTLLDASHYNFKNDKLPDGWKNETVQTSTTGNAIGWKARYGGGWISDPMKLHFPTSGANGTERCATNQSYDNTAISIMVTPPIDLSAAASPILRFYYCSPNRSGVNTMRIKYRLGPQDKQWKDVPGGVFVSGVENWQFFTVPLDEIVSKAGGNSLNMVQLGFWGEQHMGFGCCIDEIQVLEAQGTPVELVSAEYRSLGTRITPNTTDQPLACILLEERSGAGHLRLHNLNGQVSVAGGKSVTITKMNLYRTTTPDFSTEQLVSELAFTGAGSSYTITAPKDVTEKAAIPAGQSYLWIAADVAAADTKAKLYFEGTVQDGFSARFGTYISKKEAGGVVSVPYPNAAKQVFAGIKEAFAHTKECTVYAELVRTEMEGGASDWQPQGAAGTSTWAIGTPGPKTKAATPQVDKAYAGSGVLGTAELTGGKLLGRIRGSSGGAWASDYSVVLLAQEVDARHYKDVHMDMMYVSNTSGAMVYLEVAYPDAQGSYDNSLWTVVWNSQKMSMMSGWVKLQFNLSQVLDRRKFKLRFRAENLGGADANDQYFFVDNFKIIGDEMQRDLGIEWVRPVEKLSYDDGAGHRKLHVDIKVTNYGKNPIVNGDGSVEVLLNGELKDTKNAAGALGAGGTATVSVDLDLPPQQSKKPQLLDLRVKLRAQDDDPANNELSLVVPVLGQVSVTDDIGYPAVRGDVMDDWYPQSLEQAGRNSWRLALLSPVSEHFGAKPPMSYYLWTTGVRECYRYEQSALLSPVFTITGSAPKTFSVAYSIELDRQLAQYNDGGRYFEAYVEYRTQEGTGDPSPWTRLDQDPSAAAESQRFQQNWYSAGAAPGWVASTLRGATQDYRVSKVALSPSQTGGKYVQFRIVFNLRAFQTVPGMAVSGVEVRKLRPNMQIVSLLPPGELCERGENGELKLVVKNAGMVPTPADYRVPISVKGVWKHYENEASTALPKPDQLNRVLAGFDLGNMQPGTIREVPIGLSQLWWKDARNRIDLTASLNLEYNPDEDMGDNTLVVKDKKAVVPAFFPVKGLMEAGGTVYISKTNLEAALITKRGNYTFKDFTLAPQGSANGAINGDKIKVSSAATTGQFLLTYTAVGAEANGSAGQECKDQKVAFTLLTGEEQNAAIVGAAVPESCLGKASENKQMGVNVEVKVLQGSPASMTLQVKQNGQEIYSGPATAGKNELQIPSSKLVSGLSTVEFVLTVDGGDLDLSDNVYQLSKSFFRFDDPIQVFLQAANNPYNVRKLVPGSTTVTAGEQSWNLYTPDYDGQVGIQWMKDGQSVGSEMSLALGTNSGTYKVRLESKGGCGAETSEDYIIKNDDLDLLRVEGYVEGMPLCRDDKDMAELMVTVQNTSWASYPSGTEFQFAVKVGGGAPQTVKHKLQGYSLTHNGYLQPSLRFKVPSGATTADLEIKLEGVIRPGGTLEPDAKTDNNTLPAKGKDETLSFTLYSQPVVEITADKIGSVDVLAQGMVFDNDSKLTLKPGTTASISSYTWSSRNVTNYFFEPAQGTVTNGALTISGIPADVYMLEVKDSHGCKNWDTVFINQTDLVVHKLSKPGSMCDVGEAEFLEIQLANRGNQPVLWGDKAEVTVKTSNNFSRKLTCALPAIGAQGMAMLVINDTEFMQAFKKAMAGPSHRIQISLKPMPRDMDQLRQSYEYPACYERRGFAKNWDVNEMNNKKAFDVTSYGYPKVELYVLYEGEDDPVSKPGQSIIDDGREVLGANGSNAPTMQYPNVTRQKFILALRPKETNQPTVEWKYESNMSPYNIPSMEIKGEETSLNAAWAAWKAGAGAKYDQSAYTRYLPTKEMEEAMRLPAKQPVGQYDVTVSSVEGCVKSFKFMVKPAFYDMAIAGMSGPGALCDLYPQGTATVKVNLQNNGNSTFGKGTKVELQLTGQAAGYNGLSPVTVDLEPQTKTVTLDDELRQNWLRQANFTVDLENVRTKLVEKNVQGLDNPKSLDDTQLTFSAKIISLKTASGEVIYDENHANDEKVDGVVIKDLKDPLRPGFNITIGSSSPRAATAAGPNDHYTHKYEWQPTDPEIDVSRLKETMSYTVSANLMTGGAPGTYLWTANSTTPFSPNAATNEQSYKVYGPGLTTLLYSEEVEGQTCSVQASIMVFGTNPDLVVSAVKRTSGEPLVACKDNIGALNDVVIDIQNVSTKEISASDPKHKPCLEGNVELHFGDGTLDQVKDSPVVKTLHYAAGGTSWAPQGVVSTPPFSLEGIVTPSFTEPSKEFLLVAVLKPAAGCDQKPTENDVTQQGVKLIGTPDLQQYVGIEKKTPLDGAFKVYTQQPPALQVQSSGQFKNSDFVWTKPNGQTLKQTECPVDEVGDYKLEGKTIEASCPATTSVKVRRPGYLELSAVPVEQFVGIGLDDKCKPTLDFTSGAADLKAKVKIRNAGQEPLDIAQGDVLKLEIKDYKNILNGKGTGAAAPVPEYVFPSALTLAPGEEQEAEVLLIKQFGKSEEGRIVEYQGELTVAESVPADTRVKDMKETGEAEMALQQQPFYFIAPPTPEPENLSQMATNFVADAYRNAHPPMSESPDLQMVKKVDNVSLQIVLQADKSGANTYSWYKGEETEPVAKTWAYTISSSGKYKVKIENKYGCVAESEPVDIRYTLSYMFSDFKVLGLEDNSAAGGARTCVDAGAAGAKLMPRYEVTLSDAEEVLPAGAKFTVKTAVAAAPTGMPKQTVPTQDVVLVTEKEYKQGDVITIEGNEVAVKENEETTFQATLDLTQDVANKNLDMLPDPKKQVPEATVSGNAVTSPSMQFFIALKPQLKNGLMGVEGMSAKNVGAYWVYAGKGQIVNYNPISPDESADYKYTWVIPGSPSQESRDVTLKDKPPYFKLTIEDQANFCTQEYTVNYFKYWRLYPPQVNPEGSVQVKSTFKVSDAEVEASYESKGDVGEQHYERVPDQQLLKVSLLPVDPYKVVAALLYKGPESYNDGGSSEGQAIEGFEQTMSQDMKLSVTAEKGQPTPGTNPNAVESSLLQTVVVQSPFADQMNLWGVQQLKAYWFTDLVGRMLLYRSVQPAVENITISTSSLPEGLYLLCLQDREGGIRTLRVIKQH